jgi:hypothetical protein
MSQKNLMQCVIQELSFIKTFLENMRVSLTTIMHCSCPFPGYVYFDAFYTEQVGLIGNASDLYQRVLNANVASSLLSWLKFYGMCW